MTSPNTNGHTVPDPAAAMAAALDPVELNAGLGEAVRRAISGELNARAKDLAEEAIDSALTPDVLAAMRDTAAQAAAEALAPPQEQEEQEQRKLHFKTVEEFVEGYVAICYAREVSRPAMEGQIRWCPQWHEHAEAVARFEALHRAFEQARLGAAEEMSAFWRDHLDHHMGRLLDPDGPFRYCSVAKGHNDKLATLPLEAAPAGAFTEQQVELQESGLYTVTEPARRGAVVCEFP